MQYVFQSRTCNKKHKVQETKCDIGPGVPLYISTALLLIHCVDRIGHNEDFGPSRYVAVCGHNGVIGNFFKSHYVAFVVHIQDELFKFMKRNTITSQNQLGK